MEEYKNYEYFTLSADGHNSNETINRYASLGWQLDRRSHGMLHEVLTFKRERGIKNKEQLNKLQVRIEDTANGIVFLEKSKKKSPTIFASIFGSIAALIFGSGLSLIMFNAPDLTLQFISGIILGITGGVLAAVNYPIFLKYVKRKTNQANPLIEKKKDELHDLCEKANSLVANT